LANKLAIGELAGSLADETPKTYLGLRSMNLCRTIALFSIVVIFSGCGSSRDSGLADVSGKVTFDGKPLEYGTISFIPLDLNGPTSGTEIHNGSYTIGGEVGAYIGECRVEISAHKKTGEKVPSPVDPDEMTEIVVNMIPLNYNTNSTLTATIAEGENLNVDFNLQSKVENE
jgi:hypothetical protein